MPVLLLIRALEQSVFISVAPSKPKQVLKPNSRIVKRGAIIDASITNTPRRPRGRKSYEIVEDRKEDENIETSEKGYVGLSKTHAQHIMKSIAYNLYRTPGIIVSNCIR